MRAEADMTDVTNEWADGSRPRESDDPTRPAPGGDTLIPDTGAHTPPAAVAASPEGKSFRPSRRAAAEPAGEGFSDSGVTDEPLLRATLETVRVKADELRIQAQDWSRLRQDEARDFIDERPVTAIAAAFGVGLVIGALLSR
jgi:hypothetical protein